MSLARPRAQHPGHPAISYAYSYLNTHHLLPKLMPRLVSVLPVPSPAEATPRGIKRTRTPDRSGNGHTEGDQDDGTCAMRR